MKNLARSSICPLITSLNIQLDFFCYILTLLFLTSLQSIICVACALHRMSDLEPAPAADEGNDNALLPTLPEALGRDFLDIGDAAYWTATSCKPGHGIEALRDPSNEQFFEYVNISPTLDINHFICNVLCSVTPQRSVAHISLCSYCCIGLARTRTSMCTRFRSTSRRFAT